MKQRRYFKPLLYVFIFTSIVVGHFGFDIYTVFWHWSNPKSIQWNQLKIKIPEDLIAKYYDEVGKSNSLHLYLVGYPGETTISFSVIKRNLTEDAPFENLYKQLGHKLLSEVPCYHPKTKCKWFKVKTKKDEIYMEDIYLLSKNYHIIYFGTIENRHYLIEVFENMKFKNNQESKNGSPE